MEKIRTYDLADLRKASRRYQQNRNGKFHANNLDLKASMLGLRGAHNDAVDIANEMRETHKDWAIDKLNPLLPWLQQENIRLTDDKAIEQFYFDGVKESVTAFALTGRFSMPDYQDIITGYTASFINILRTCQRLDVKPFHALTLASHANKVDIPGLPEFFADNSDLPKNVIARAAGFGKDGNSFLYSYRRIDGYNKFFEAEYAEYKDRNRPVDIFTPLEDIAVSKEIAETFKKKGVYIEGVPELHQRHINWCGFTSLSMLLQYNGYTDLTPERLFKETYYDYDPILETLDISRGPGVDTLALLAKDLTPLTPRILDEKQYAALRQKNSAMETPADVLKFFMKNKIPAMIRRPGHWVVARGYNDWYYNVNDPAKGAEIPAQCKPFEQSWASEDLSYPRDSKNLMLVLMPPRKKN